MKKIIFILSILFSITAYAQDTCSASVMKHTGKSDYKKSSLKLIHKIDIDKECKYNILGFTIEFTTHRNHDYYKYDLPGNEIPEKVSKHLIEADDKITFSNILIGTGRGRTKPINLPDIVLTVVR